MNIGAFVEDIEKRVESIPVRSVPAFRALRRHYSKRLALSGPAWRQGQIQDQAIAEWAKSTVRWWRRAALVSTVPLNFKARGGWGDAPRTLRICALLIGDRDEMIVKALSWAGDTPG